MNFSSVLLALLAAAACANAITTGEINDRTKANALTLSSRVGESGGSAVTQKLRSNRGRPHRAGIVTLKTSTLTEADGAFPELTVSKRNPLKLIVDSNNYLDLPFHLIDMKVPADARLTVTLLSETSDGVSIYAGTWRDCCTLERALILFVPLLDFSFYSYLVNGTVTDPAFGAQVLTTGALYVALDFGDFTTPGKTYTVGFSVGPWSERPRSPRSLRH